MARLFRFFDLPFLVLAGLVVLLSGFPVAAEPCTCDEVAKGTCVPPGAGTGQVKCTTPIPHPGFELPIPPGSYTRTCPLSVLDGNNTLRAQCRDFNGHLVDAMLMGVNVPPCLDDIENCNGRLFCDKGGTPPPGSYKDSCRCRHVSGTTLTADCKRSDGSWTGDTGISTSLQNFGNCRNGVDNVNGELKCH
jgi:hypothetical protein